MLSRACSLRRKRTLTSLSILCMALLPILAQRIRSLGLRRPSCASTILLLDFLVVLVSLVFLGIACFASLVYFFICSDVFFCLFVIRYCSVLFCCTGMTSLSAMRSLSTTTRSSAVSGILFGSFLTAPSWFYVATSSSFLLLAPIGISNMSARVSSGIKTPTTLTSFWTPSTALPTMLTSSS